MANKILIGPYSAYAIAVKHGYQGTEEEWVEEQETNRTVSEQAAQNAAASATAAAGSAAAAQSSQQAAEGSARTAEGEAERAKTKADTAANSANTARTAVNQANQAKEAAAASANQAADSAANAQQSAGAANTSAGQAAASASQAAGSAAAAGETLTRVQTAGQEAQQKVQDAETEALDKIAAAAPALPSVSADTAWQSVTVKPDGAGYNLAAMAPIEAAIRPTVTGNPVVCINSATWGLQGLKIYGKSTQDGTPSPENPVPIVSAGDNGNVKVTVCGSNLLDLSKGKNGTGEGVTFTKHPDGSYQMTGTATDVSGNVWFLGNYSGSEALFILAPGTYFVQDCELFFNRTYIGGSGKIVLNSFTLVGGVRNPTMVSGKEYNTTLYPAIFVGETAQPWTPYTGKNLALSTPTGLLGIPVENGGNYTDSTGQQWICDEINFSKGKKITRIQSVTITPASNLYTATGKDLLSFALKLPSFAFNTSGDTVKTKWFCDTYKISTEGLVGSSENEAAGIYNQNQMSTLFINDRRFSTVGEYKTWLTNNPVTILYALASPIESDISPEELSAYHALTTYDGTTVVSTAEPVAGIEAQYIMDGTAAWNKISAALAQIGVSGTQTYASYEDLSGAVREGVNKTE